MFLLFLSTLNNYTFYGPSKIQWVMIVKKSSLLQGLDVGNRCMKLPCTLKPLMFSTFWKFFSFSIVFHFMLQNLKSMWWLFFDVNFGYHISFMQIWVRKCNSYVCVPFRRGNVFLPLPASLMWKTNVMMIDGVELMT